jgi:hypothetical protein
MWRDERGLVHTAVRSHWTELVKMSSGSYAAFRAMPAAWLHDALDEVEDDFFEQVTQQKADPAEEARFVDRMPPRMTLGLLGPATATVEVLTGQLRRQPLRWRLDYVWALRDCLTELGELKAG